MKPPYSYYTEKMWRDFIPRWRWNTEHRTIQAMLPVQCKNYEVCDEVWKGLDDKERAIIEAETQSEHERIGNDMRELAEQYHMNVNEVWQVAFRILRKTALKRGLLDYN